MGKPFRVTSVSFDEDEEVAVVTAIARGPSLDVIQAHAPNVPVGLGGSVTLSVIDVLQLHGVAGKKAPVDPEYAGSSPLYDSLCMVIYGLIDTE